MSYELFYDSHAQKDLRHLDARMSARVQRQCALLAERAELASHKALREPFQGVFSLKVGDYRALYTLDHKSRTVLVVAVAHRSRVHRA